MLVWLIALSFLTALSLGANLLLHKRLTAEAAVRAEGDANNSQAIMTIEGRRNRLLRRIRIAQDQLASELNPDERDFHRWAFINGQRVDTHVRTDAPPGP